MKFLSKALVGAGMILLATAAAQGQEADEPAPSENTSLIEKDYLFQKWEAGQAWVIRPEAGEQVAIGPGGFAKYRKDEIAKLFGLDVSLEDKSQMPDGQRNPALENFLKGLADIGINLDLLPGDKPSSDQLSQISQDQLQQASTKAAVEQLLKDPTTNFGSDSGGAYDINSTVGSFSIGGRTFGAGNVSVNLAGDNPNPDANDRSGSTGKEATFGVDPKDGREVVSDVRIMYPTRGPDGGYHSVKFTNGQASTVLVDKAPESVEAIEAKKTMEAGSWADAWDKESHPTVSARIITFFSDLFSTSNPASDNEDAVSKMENQKARLEALAPKVGANIAVPAGTGTPEPERRPTLPKGMQSNPLASDAGVMDSSLLKGFIETDPDGEKKSDSVPHKTSDQPDMAP